MTGDPPLVDEIVHVREGGVVHGIKRVDRDPSGEPDDRGVGPDSGGI